MNWFLAFILGFLGSLLSEWLFADSFPSWILAVLFCILGFWLAGFLKYMNKSPKDMLAFHGIGSPLSKSDSLNEVKAFISCLYKGGLIKGINLDTASITMNDIQWKNLEHDELLTLCEIFGRALELEKQDNKEISLLDEHDNVVRVYTLKQNSYVLTSETFINYG